MLRLHSALKVFLQLVWAQKTDLDLSFLFENAMPADQLVCVTRGVSGQVGCGGKIGKFRLSSFLRIEFFSWSRD